MKKPQEQRGTQKQRARDREKGKRNLKRRGKKQREVRERTLRARTSEKIKRKPMRKRQVWNNTGNPNLPSPSQNIRALDIQQCYRERKTSEHKD